MKARERVGAMRVTVGAYSVRQLISSAVPWRLKSRLKTFNAGLFICLNIGVDPPDVFKTNPCAKLECWLDPTALPSTKAIEAIGRSESTQMNRLMPRSSTAVRDPQSKGEIPMCEFSVRSRSDHSSTWTLR